MKVTKKLFALLLVVVMALALGVSALADDPVEGNTITITNESTNQHTYTAYQVFAGEYDDETGVLSNIKWGDGVNGEDLLDALKETTDFAACTDAADVANVLKDYGDDSAALEAFAEIVNKNLIASAGQDLTAAAATKGYTYTLEDVDDGYYFIKDTGDIENGDSATKYILQVVDDVNIAAKSGTVEVEKTVATGGYACGKEEDKWYYDESGLPAPDDAEGATKHTHDATACGLVYAKGNTASVGDTVNFKIESAVPAEAADGYDYYYFIIGDTLSDGLLFDSAKANIVVKIGTDTAIEGTDYTIRYAKPETPVDGVDYCEDGYTFQIALIDAIGNAGKNVVVTYDAVVDLDAVIGIGGNTNEVTVDFSHNPNDGGDGDKISEDGFPAEEDDGPEGTTPKSTTKTFVTEVNITKVDMNDADKYLEGAKFEIAGEAQNIVIVSKEVYKLATAEQIADENTVTYFMLKDGKYTDAAPTVDSIRIMDDDERAVATGGYVKDSTATGNGVVTIDGVTYRPAKTSEIAGDTDLYILSKGTADDYDDTTKQYVLVEEISYDTDTKDFVAEGYTDKDGKLVFTGLAAGTYTITELVAPDGYNLLEDPIEITIECTMPTEITGNAAWTVVGDEADDEIDVSTDGKITVTIGNASGSILPSTGGIGTKIFYGVGGLLVVGAAVLLITKKRMHSEG